MKQRGEGGGVGTGEKDESLRDGQTEGGEEGR